VMGSGRCDGKNKEVKLVGFVGVFKRNTTKVASGE